MFITVIIPAYNEERYLPDCLDSMIKQTRRPDELIVVDDNSSDQTFDLAKAYSHKHNWIKVYKNSSDKFEHLPGAKVVKTFNLGFSKVNRKFDLVGKFDADLILPGNYFEVIEKEFQENARLGMCSGLLVVQDENKNWTYENISSKTHIRGPIKMYSKECFEKIEGIRPSIGWDSVDELLAKYYGFETETIKDLHVKHLRPTWASYSKKTKLLQGEALYKMRYGIFLSVLTAGKISFKKRDLKIFSNYLFGYLKAKKSELPFIVKKEEGKFIRKYRWKNILNKFLLFR